MYLKTPTAFPNRCNYDNHFIIKEFTEEFERQFTCLGENTKKYITFTIPIEKEVTWINKNEEKLKKYIYLLASLLSNLVNSLLKELIKLNINGNIKIENLKLAELNINIGTIHLNTQILKMI